MNSLIIKATDDSPGVVFDTSSNRFTIAGESRPENAGKFYTPIINWVSDLEETLRKQKEETKENSKLVFVFKLDYFNSTSAKYIVDMLLSLKKIAKQGHIIGIEWHYDKRGDDMLDAGKEFADMVGLKFDLVPF